MDITYGVSGGLTFSAVNAVFMVDGKEVGKSNQVGSGLLGYNVGVFGSMPINNRVSFDAEIGYDVARFASYQSIFDKVSIRHIRIGVLGQWLLLKRMGVIGGVELVRRGNDVTGPAGLGGADVSGLHWQGIAGIRGILGTRLKIDARVSVPEIGTVTGVHHGVISQNMIWVEQLRIFKLVASYTIFPR